MRQPEYTRCYTQRLIIKPAWTGAVASRPIATAAKYDNLAVFIAKPVAFTKQIRNNSACFFVIKNSRYTRTGAETLNFGTNGTIPAWSPA
jgi:hypothetical protein